MHPIKLLVRNLINSDKKVGYMYYCDDRFYKYYHNGVEVLTKSIIILSAKCVYPVYYNAYTEKHYIKLGRFNGRLILEEYHTDDYGRPLKLQFEFTYYMRFAKTMNMLRFLMRHED